MDNELQTLVQLLELQGRGLGAFIRAIQFTAKEVKSGVDYAKVKNIQHKIKLHYASTGKHKTMKLKDLEKITGAQYNILNIPLEDEEKLTQFYDHLKKMRVSFAELPDLQVGDGYTQIAYNPLDAEKVKFVVQQFRKYLSEEAKDIDVDEYMKMAGPDGEELLTELAAKGYTDEMHVEHLERIQKMVASKEYIPISLNMESLLLSEDKENYVLKMPKGRTNAVFDHAIVIPKKDALILDDGQTIFTALKVEDKLRIYSMTSGEAQLDKPLDLNFDEMIKAFAPVDMDKLKYVSNLKPENVKVFPSFLMGQEQDEVDGPALTEGQEKPTEQMGKIIQLEELKKRQGNPEYVSLSFDMGQMVAEDKHVYVANLPNYMDEKAELVRCMKIKKSDAIVSEDGKRLLAYLKKSDSSNILEYDGTGKKIREFAMENEKLAKDVLKDQFEKGISEHAHEHVKAVVEDIASHVRK